MNKVENKTLSVIGFSPEQTLDENGRPNGTTTHRLTPGVNECSDEAMQYLKSHPIMKHLFLDGKLVDMGGSDLASMKTADAKVLIKKTFDLQALGRWSEEKLSLPVRKALDAHVEALTNPNIGEDKYMTDGD